MVTISADKLITYVLMGHKVSARINPNDLVHINVDGLQKLLRLVSLVPDPSVDVGFLEVSIK